VLLVRWLTDTEVIGEEFATIRPGQFLATSPGCDLWVTDQGSLDQFYDPAPDGLDR
jgi:hypothetical protein